MEKYFQKINWYKWLQNEWNSYVNYLFYLLNFDICNCLLITSVLFKSNWSKLTNFDNLVQSINANEWIHVREVGKIISCKETFLQKHAWLIDSNWEGKMIDSNEIHSEKQYAGNILIELCKVISESDWQLSKQFSPSEITFVGIVIAGNDLQWEKQLFPREVIVSGIVIDFNE